MKDYKLTKKYPVHKGNVMDFYECEIELPDGQTTHWDLIHHPGGAAVLPIDEDGNLILVRQYRVGADDYLLEIPAGKADSGEDSLTTIKREMEEEIGYISDDIELLLTFLPAPAYSEERTDIYVAKNLIKTQTRPDSDEFLEPERISVSDALKLIYTQKIIDGKTIAAVTAYYSRIHFGSA